MSESIKAAREKAWKDFVGDNSGNIYQPISFNAGFDAAQKVADGQTAGGIISDESTEAASSFYQSHMPDGACYRPTTGQEPSISYLMATYAQKVADEQTADLRNRLEAYEWRRVEDGLPDSCREVWITTEFPGWIYPRVSRGQFDTLENQWNQIVLGIYQPLYEGQWVTAWMEIASDPQPFKELQEATK
jgi:hypothetical protein